MPSRSVPANAVWNRVLNGHETLAKRADCAVARFNQLSDWMQPVVSNHKGMLLTRPQPQWTDYQTEIDTCYNAGQLNGEPGKVQLDIDINRGYGLVERLKAASDEILSVVTYLPNPLTEQIESDILTIGGLVGGMFPSSGKLVLRLEVLGENVCSRWHQDNCIGRAIVSYTGSGTMWAEDPVVDFWELENCGANECVIKDQSGVHMVELGDVLFMKGLKHSDAANRGLVHKAPEKLYHEDGRVVNRLVLKIDVGLGP